MRKYLKTIIIIMVIFLLSIFLYMIFSERKNEDFIITDEINTALTLDDKIENDTIWCGTFQLIWNDLKNDLAKQDIVFLPQLDVVKNLNKETFSTKDISEEFYYKKLGIASLNLKEEIEKAIKDKFNEKSDILNDFMWEKEDEKNYFLYVMLKKEFEFKKSFDKLKNAKFQNYDNIEYFGIDSDNMTELNEQVDVLYYQSKDDFAIKLKTKEKDEIILCKNPTGQNFNEIFQNIKQNEKQYKGNKSLAEGENLKIPNLKIKVKKEFKEIQNKEFVFSDGSKYEIDKAIQTIDFELDKKGGRIKSEAGMMVNRMSVMPDFEEKREFYIDNTFAIFLQENDKEKPYFAGLIEDITKFQ